MRAIRIGIVSPCVGKGRTDPGEGVRVGHGAWTGHTVTRSASTRPALPKCGAAASSARPPTAPLNLHRPFVRADCRPFGRC